MLKFLKTLFQNNLKANIAFGGKGSQHTRIDKNEISESVAEGIFLVDGENHTYINENIIRDNLDGISLFNSKGQITQNLIEGNQRWGIQCSGTTSADITSNQIKSNILIGLLIKEPSLPKIQSNVMKDNHYQISVDKHVAKKFQSYKTLNTIKGAWDVPKSTWSIF